MATTMTDSMSNAVEAVEPPKDSVSSLSFSGHVDYLAASSWDGSVRIYEVNAKGQTQGKAGYHHPGPVLDVCWDQAGNHVFSSGVDNIGLMFDIVTGQTQQVAQHHSAIKAIKWLQVQGTGVLATGSWDKTIKYWDLRSASPVVNVDIPERLFALDTSAHLMAAGTADNHVHVFDIRNTSTPLKVRNSVLALKSALSYPLLSQSITSPLKFQIRAVRWCKASASPALAFGGVDGRLAIQYINSDEQDRNYTFRCHMSPSDSQPRLKQTSVYAVNDISFHPTEGTFATAGSDGFVKLWDGNSRIVLGFLDNAGAPITATEFNRDGKLFAYAVGYDWSSGHQGMTSNVPVRIYLRESLDKMKRKIKRSS